MRLGTHRAAQRLTGNVFANADVEPATNADNTPNEREERSVVQAVQPHDDPFRVPVPLPHDLRHDLAVVGVDHT